MRTFARLKAKLGYLVTLFLACALAMGVSFALVLGLGRRTAPEPGPRPDMLRETKTLEAFSNELASLLDEYLRRFRKEGDPVSDSFNAWVSHSFQPQLNDFRRRASASDLSAKVREALLAARDAVDAMAQASGRADARRKAFQKVLEARDAVANRIAELGAAHLLDEPLRSPRGVGYP
ncbi:MAG TPA: hypothetical protein HPP77_03515 [Candidatus Hydrogenedentes bacterium]|nr:hypothetical protein [Candidatus Hydrogenedentota bacterium]HIJ74352.1 hypothetical protein [Candidatus Hydrogenedentota bacterium]